jgi:N-acetylmuramic acid 6-phosphate etherase
VERQRIDEGFLGIEGGATRTVAILSNRQREMLQRAEEGPANLRLLSDSQLVTLFRSFASKFPQPAAIGIGLAGARTKEDHRRILDAAAQAWPKIACVASHDLDTALLAAPASEEWRARVLVLSGTGSCCYGTNLHGERIKIGGWGHLLGDKGGGYHIGLRALKAIVYYYDRDQVWPNLGSQVLRRLQLNQPDDLIGWIQTAEKQQVAALAREVFDAWHAGDKIARDIIKAAARGLARDAIACALRLASPRSEIQFVFAGSILLHQPRFTRMISIQIRRSFPRARCEALRRESAWGAVELAIRNTSQTSAVARPSKAPKELPLDAVLPQAMRLSPTEQRNRRSLKLDRLPIAKLIALMLREESRVAAAVLAQRRDIERAIRLIVRSFRNSGRLLYVGAGTSGRLGVLDASECPPTFRSPPDMVQGVIAGGQQALWCSIEGAEDNIEEGARAVQFRNVRPNDVVVGIAASGRTPFVWGALTEAKRRKAATVLVCFNRHLHISPKLRPNVIIAADTGPEVLTGSTRLKAGTATKLILNLFTTLAMVRLGKTVSNLMVDLKPSNTKLRQRAVRIVQQLIQCPAEEARLRLERCEWEIKRAIQ